MVRVSTYRNRPNVCNTKGISDWYGESLVLQLGGRLARSMLSPLPRLILRVPNPRVFSSFALRRPSLPEVFTVPEVCRHGRVAMTGNPSRRLAEVTASTCTLSSTASERDPSSQVNESHGVSTGNSCFDRCGLTAGESDIFLPSRSSSTTGTSGAPREFHRRSSDVGRPMVRAYQNTHTLNVPISTRAPRAFAMPDIDGPGTRKLDASKTIVPPFNSRLDELSAFLRFFCR